MPPAAALECSWILCIPHSGLAPEIILISQLIPIDRIVDKRPFLDISNHEPIYEP